MRKLTKKLPKIIADALNVPENPAYHHLIEDNIEIVAEELSGDYNRNTPDLEIIIWASEYPERLKTIGERRSKICRSVEDILIDNRNINGHVRLLLQPASFGRLFGLEGISSL